MTAYYNEIDPFAAAWLRELIKAGHIAPGEVDERSIEDVLPSDLAGFAQCHFFAGIGVWSHALRQAGWPDERPVWTGSCPCQPFSSAGEGLGFADERHLWPAFFHLIKECRPERIFGEQVASGDGLAWLDLVSSDLEGEGYACGATDTCAAGFGAPHLRQRLYWVAHNQSGRRGQEQQNPGRGREGANAPEYETGGLSPGCPTSGFWRNADWLLCRDGLWRPTQSISEPLADGLAHRLGYSRFKDLFSLNPLKKTEKEDMRTGRLRSYGNAIVAPQAIEFIRAVMAEI